VAGLGWSVMASLTVREKSRLSKPVTIWAKRTAIDAYANPARENSRAVHAGAPLTVLVGFTLTARATTQR
jgi:hypothetical protein